MLSIHMLERSSMGKKINGKKRRLNKPYTCRSQQCQKTVDVR